MFFFTDIKVSRKFWSEDLVYGLYRLKAQEWSPEKKATWPSAPSDGLAKNISIVDMINTFFNCNFMGGLPRSIHMIFFVCCELRPLMTNVNLYPMTYIRYTNGRHEIKCLKIQIGHCIDVIAYINFQISDLLLLCYYLPICIFR